MKKGRACDDGVACADKQDDTAPNRIAARPSIRRAGRGPWEASRRRRPSAPEAARPIDELPPTTTTTTITTTNIRRGSRSRGRVCLPYCFPVTRRLLIGFSRFHWHWVFFRDLAGLTDNWRSRFLSIESVSYFPMNYWIHFLLTELVFFIYGRFEMHEIFLRFWPTKKSRSHVASI